MDRWGLWGWVDPLIPVTMRALYPVTVGILTVIVWAIVHGWVVGQPLCLASEAQGSVFTQRSVWALLWFRCLLGWGPWALCIYSDGCFIMAEGRWCCDNSGKAIFPPSADDRDLPNPAWHSSWAVGPPSSTGQTSLPPNSIYLDIYGRNKYYIKPQRNISKIKGVKGEN